MDLATGIVSLLTMLATFAFRAWEKKQKESGNAEKKLAAVEKRDAERSMDAVDAEYRQLP